MLAILPYQIGMWSRVVLLPFVALAACGKEPSVSGALVEIDPAVVAVLADPIMIDPDLASQNHGNAAITLNAFDAVPLDDTSAEAVATARAEALRLLGGTLKPAPEATVEGPALAPAITAGQLAAQLPNVSGRCLEGLRYAYAWADGLPPALPLYPRGHVQEAAGNAACGLRAIVFTTPVDSASILDFYFTRARAAGFDIERRRQGTAELLAGAKGAAAFLVRIRTNPTGLSEVEFATRS